MSTVKKFVTGIEGLDKLLGEITSPYALLIAGHPGAGKTTLTTTICYANALKGKRCLYISFYEDKEKFYMYMKRLGMDLESLESKGLFRYIKLPLVFDVEVVAEEITKLVSEGYDILVIDSVTVLLEPIRDAAEKRAWLLNYFYQLQKALNGLIILIAELPFGEEKLGLGSIEFVVDGILILKHRIEDGFLTRALEIRKVRGAPIYIAEASFTITEGVGITVFAPPTLAEPAPEKEEVYELCSIGGEPFRIRKGFIVNLFYPPGPAPGVDALINILSLVAKYNLKTLVISYTRSADVIYEAIKRRLAELGIDGDKAEKLINKYMTIVALNPFGYSITQLLARELTIIERAKPEVVVFWGVQTSHLAKQSYATSFKELFNEMMYLKSKGVTVFRVGHCLNEQWCEAESTISDITFRFNIIRKDDKFVEEVIIYRRYREPKIHLYEAIAEFTKCNVEVLKQIAKEL